jgi:hypothetical protein
MLIKAYLEVDNGGSITILSCVCVTTDGVWIGDSIYWTGFTAHLQIVTTSNCIAIGNSHTLHFTAAHTKSSQFVFISLFLVRDPNNVLCLRPYWLTNVSHVTKL